MTAYATIARPYAKAAFEYAVANDQLDQWANLLALASKIVIDPQLTRLLHHPKVTSEQLASLFHDLCASLVDEHGRNFISLLAERNRLEALPAMAAFFNRYREDYENTVSVVVQTPHPLTDEQNASLTKALTKRLERDVTLDIELDKSLIGGLRIQANNLVIDGSIRNQLSRMAESLTT